MARLSAAERARANEKADTEAATEHLLKEEKEKVEEEERKEQLIEKKKEEEDKQDNNRLEKVRKRVKKETQKGSGGKYLGREGRR